LEVTNSGNLEDYNNDSFFFTGLMFMFFIVLVVISLLHTQAVWLKSVLSLGLAILVMALTRFAGWFIEITNPAETELIDTMAHYFMFSVYGMWFVIIAAIFITIIVILNLMNDKKKDKEW